MLPDVQNVSDRASFLAFMAAFNADLRENAAGWENSDLPRFLEAMLAWATDSKFELSPNPWRHAASLLMAARIYE